MILFCYFPHFHSQSNQHCASSEFFSFFFANHPGVYATFTLVATQCDSSHPFGVLSRSLLAITTRQRNHSRQQAKIFYIHVAMLRMTVRRSTSCCRCYCCWALCAFVCVAIRNVLRNTSCSTCCLLQLHIHTIPVASS